MSTKQGHKGQPPSKEITLKSNLKNDQYIKDTP